MLELLRQIFDKYWGDLPSIFGMAIILDPRFKIEDLNVFLEIIYNDDVKNIQETIQSFQYSMTRLFDLLEIETRSGILIIGFSAYLSWPKPMITQEL